MSRIFNVKQEVLKDIFEFGLDFNSLYVLECIANKDDLSHLNEDKLLAWKQNLTRKGFISENEEITISGSAILLSVFGLALKRTLKENKSKAITGFDAWWKAYPSVDIFEYKGKRFEGNRGFKVKKDECRLKFERIVNEGEYTAEDLIRALEYEVLVKKEASIRENINKLQYLQNSLTYLNQRSFENFIEVSKTVLITLKSPQNNVFDL